MLTREQILERNKLIGENGIRTRIKRATQTCKTFKFKIPYNDLNCEQKECLKMMFVEAKWIYNYLLNQESVYDVDYRDLVDITHKDKDFNNVPVTIKYLKSSTKKEVISQIIRQINVLHKLKEKGYKVGKLKFKSEFNSIRLIQYNVTHSIRGDKFKIQGIKQSIKVLGLDQLNKYKNRNIEYTIANLLYDGINYFIALTCYMDKQERTYENDIVGIDMGVSTTLTLSDGIKYNVLVEESEKLKKLQRKFANQKNGSNNKYKTSKKIRKEYIHLSNIKDDMANKIVSSILRKNKIVVIQNEQLLEWHQDGYSNSKV